MRCDARKSASLVFSIALLHTLNEAFVFGECYHLHLRDKPENYAWCRLNCLPSSECRIGLCDASIPQPSPMAACAETGRKFDKSCSYFPTWLIHVPEISNNLITKDLYRKMGGNVNILRGIEHKSRVIRKAYDSGIFRSRTNSCIGQSFSPMIGAESFFQWETWKHTVICTYFSEIL